MNKVSKREAGIGIGGILIGALFGWIILYVLMALFGVTIYGITYFLLNGIPILITVGAVYLFVRWLSNRRDYRKWKRSNNR